MHPEPGSKRSWLSYNDVSKRLINRGGMCERLKQAVLKTAIPERVSGVRIPLPPPLTSLVGNYLAPSTARPAAPSGSPLEHNRSTLRLLTTAALLQPHQAAPS